MDSRWLIPSQWGKERPSVVLALFEMVLSTSRVAHRRSGNTTPLLNHMGYHYHQKGIPDIL